MVKHTMERKIESETFSIPVNLIERLKQEVVVKLEVENIFKLNDKLDGVFYLHKQLKRVLSIYVVERFLNIKLLNQEKLLKSKSSIVINDTRIFVIGVEYGEKIKIPKIDVDLFLVVGFLDNHKRGRVLGCITQEDCLKLNEPKESKNSVISKEIIAVVRKENLKEFSNDTTKK